MHESGIVRDLLRRLEAAAREQGARGIVAVRVWLGALSQFSAEHFRTHFEEEARGTLAQGARVEIEVSTDLLHADAQQVVVHSVELEV